MYPSADQGGAPASPLPARSDAWFVGAVAASMAGLRELIEYSADGRYCGMTEPKREKFE
jgi:hypothetical protein